MQSCTLKTQVDSYLMFTGSIGWVVTCEKNFPSVFLSMCLRITKVIRVETFFRDIILKACISQSRSLDHPSFIDIYLKY